MSISASELRDYVIKPTLKQLNQYTPAAVELLLGTAACESGLGQHLQQEGDGLGLFRISPETHRKVWDEYLAHKPEEASLVRGLASQREFLNHPNAELVTNLAYATTIAWYNYLRCGLEVEQLDAQNIHQLAQKWLQHYNVSCLGCEHFVACFSEFFEPCGLMFDEALSANCN